MSEHYGWSFWADARMTEQTHDGWRVYKKNGLVTECGPGQQPGDADCPIWHDDPDAPYQIEVVT